MANPQVIIHSPAGVNDALVELLLGTNCARWERIHAPGYVVSMIYACAPGRGRGGGGGKTVSFPFELNLSPARTRLCVSTKGGRGMLPLATTGD